MQPKALRKVQARDESAPKIWNCEHCDETVIAVDNYDLSRFSISLQEARVLRKFGYPVYNIWRRPPGIPGWRAVQWWGYKDEPPVRGRLYAEHNCWARK